MKRDRPAQYAEWTSTINENLTDLLKELREIGRRMEALEASLAAMERRVAVLEAKVR